MLSTTADTRLKWQQKPTKHLPLGKVSSKGYNTLDALASVAFSVIAVTTLNQLGFTSRKEYIKTIWIVGIVVAIGFSILYIGLGYLGNHFPIPAEVMASDANKGVYVLSEATKAIFGPVAQIFLTQVW